VYNCDSFERKELLVDTRQMRGNIKLFDSEIDKEHPELLANLVQRMTFPVYEGRITAGEALNHGWFKIEEELRLPESRGLLSRLFGSKNPKGGKTRKYKFTKRKRKIKTKRKRKQLSNNKKSK
jgi:hypothetical protein